MTMNGPVPGEGVSAFGGHVLAEVAEIPADVVDTLAALDITDAEQIVALAGLDTARQLLGEVLGGSTKATDEIVAKARASVQEHRAAALETPGEYNLATGALKPTADMVAATDEMPRLEAAEAPTALPPAVNWVKKLGPVRNQAARGTCVAFAVTAMHEFVRQAEGRPQDFSEQHLYYETKLVDGRPNDCGTFQARAVQALADRGQCRDAIWPYNPNAPCNNHGTLPPSARGDGSAYRLRTVSIRPNDVGAIKTALAAGAVVPISIPVYDSWYLSAATRNTGRITMRIGNEQSDSGHAVCLVGYQDETTAPGGGYFIVRNSWANWGAQSPYGAGYGTIPYQYVADDNWESFTAIPEPVEEEIVRVQHDLRVEFLGRGAECWVRFASFQASNLHAATAVDITRLRLRSWQGDRVIDEFVAEPREGTREIALRNLRLRANGNRDSWSHRVTWDWTHSRRVQLSGESGTAGAESSGGELAASGNAADEDASGSPPISIDAGPVSIVIRVGRSN